MTPPRRRRLLKYMPSRRRSNSVPRLPSGWRKSSQSRSSLGLGRPPFNHDSCRLRRGRSWTRRSQWWTCSQRHRWSGLRRRRDSRAPWSKIIPSRVRSCTTWQTRRFSSTLWPRPANCRVLSLSSAAAVPSPTLISSQHSGALQSALRLRTRSSRSSSSTMTPSRRNHSMSSSRTRRRYRSTTQTAAPCVMSKVSTATVIYTESGRSASLSARNLRNLNNSSTIVY